MSISPVGKTLNRPADNEARKRRRPAAIRFVPAKAWEVAPTSKRV